MNFDIKHIPFSRFGSYISVSYLREQKNLQEGIYIRNIRGGDNHNGAVFKVDVVYRNEIVPFKPKLTNTSLQLEAEQGYIQLIMPENDYLYFKGENVGLRLTLVTGSYDNAFLDHDYGYNVNVFTKNIRFMLRPVMGELNVDAPWEVNRSTHVVADFVPEDNSNVVKGTIEEFLTSYEPKDLPESFDAACQKVKADFARWDQEILKVPERFSRGRKLASYITWSSVVEKQGFLPRPAMYMSKNWMTNIWSWDNCFNAMALTKNNLDLAWDQLMIFFDIQDESGLIPDFMNDQFAYWNCSKPPIHGWTLHWMMQRNKIETSKLGEIYEPLTKWTNWYLEHRVPTEGFMPVYHHGNDSGWDNSTVFAEGVPVESPDLSAFLVLQMDVLAEIAGKLGRDDEQRKWHELSNQTLENMLERFWDGERFYAKLHGERVTTGDSLLLYIPIILGKRLPEDIIQKLVAGLKDEERFLTTNGLATESKKSKYYLDDGYWRGPIWAPSTMILIDGLMSAEETEFARELAEKFCLMASKNGMAENFDAKTGEGLRDRAFTWTSSVFLILANEYC